MHSGRACAPPQTMRAGSLGATKKRTNVTTVMPMNRTNDQRIRPTTYWNTPSPPVSPREQARQRLVGTFVPVPAATGRVLLSRDVRASRETPYLGPPQLEMRRRLGDNRRVPVAADVGVVGRESELARMRSFVAALPGGPRALAVCGEPGIGKTSLWRACVEAAEASGCHVLSARCAEAELPLAFVGLSDLFAEGLPTAADELTEHERAALATALGLMPPGRRQLDPIVLPRAFLGLLRVLARDAPVLVAIDDVQWLDSSSAGLVAFAARRLREEAIGLLVTRRADARDPLELDRAFQENRLEELHPAPLSLGALARLIRLRFDLHIPRPTLARVRAASGGNPMFALEFARSLDRDRPQLGPIAIPASLKELVRARVERCPDDVRRLLSLVAAAERPTMSLLEAVDPASPDLIVAAVGLEVVTVGDGELVRFTHPLLGSAVYGGLPPPVRRSLHAKLAQVSEDLEERARHRALAANEPDGSVAALLDAAAARAAARGAPEAAAEL